MMNKEELSSIKSWAQDATISRIPDATQFNISDGNDTMVIKVRLSEALDVEITVDFNDRRMHHATSFTLEEYEPLKELWFFIRKEYNVQLYLAEDSQYRKTNDRWKTLFNG